MTTRDIAALVAQIPPGSHYRLDIRTLQIAARMTGRLLENTYGFPLPDCVLEHIVGSGYEFGYTEDLLTGDIDYFRLATPLTDGRRTYVSPDQRWAFKPKTFDGIYEPIVKDGDGHLRETSTKQE